MVLKTSATKIPGRAGNRRRKWGTHTPFRSPAEWSQTEIGSLINYDAKRPSPKIMHRKDVEKKATLDIEGGGGAAAAHS